MPQLEDIQDQATDTQVERTDFDGVLKGSIREFAEHIIQRLLPELYAAMNHTRKIRFLDKELLDVLPGAQTQEPARFVDSLLEVPLQDGKKKWVLLHIEIQGPGGRAKIAVRMLHYCSLIYAHYHRLPVALLLLTSPHRKERTDGIILENFGTELSYCYNCIDIENLDEQALYNSDNLGDLMLYAVKRVVKLNRKRKSQRNPLKVKVLTELGRVLYEKHWRKKKAKLAAGLMWRLFNLPVPMLDKVLVTWKEEGIKVAEFMTHLEQRGFDRGLAKGRAEGEAKGRAEGRAEGKAEGKAEATIEMIRNFLTQGISLDIIAKACGMSLDHVRELAKA